MNNQEKEIKKENLLKQLNEFFGSITAACKHESVGVSRTTFYVWKKEDEIFAQKANDIIREKKREMDDFAEGKLYEHIREGNIAALIFYLKTRHPKYRLKAFLELGGKVRVTKELSEEQKQQIIETLKHGGFIPKDNRGQESANMGSKE